MSLKFTNLRQQSNPPGANELNLIYILTQPLQFCVNYHDVLDSAKGTQVYMN